jgi:hypothetical protein
MQNMLLSLRGEPGCAAQARKKRVPRSASSHPGTPADPDPAAAVALSSASDDAGGATRRIIIPAAGPPPGNAAMPRLFLLFPGTAAERGRRKEKFGERKEK